MNWHHDLTDDALQQSSENIPEDNRIILTQMIHQGRTCGLIKCSEAYVRARLHADICCPSNRPMGRVNQMPEGALRSLETPRPPPRSSTRARSGVYATGDLRRRYRTSPVSL